MAISRRDLLAAAGLGGAIAAADPLGVLRAGSGAASAATVTPALTTWDVTVQRAGNVPLDGYQTLIPGLGEPHIVRNDLWHTLGHATMPLAAFVQMTDLHIVDDQSRPGWSSWTATRTRRTTSRTPPARRTGRTEFLSTHIVEAMFRPSRASARARGRGCRCSSRS